MAHPKRKISKTRRDKRRTHYKAVAPGGAVHPVQPEKAGSHPRAVVALRCGVGECAGNEGPH